jgi:hypothetical protein
MGIVYYARRGLAICLGAAMLAYGAWLSWRHFGDVMGPLVALGGAGLLILAEHCVDERRRAFATLFAVLGLVGSVICANVVLTRTSETDAGKVQAATSGNLARVQAEAGLKDAQAALADAKAALAVAEARRKTECATGRGQHCRALEAKEDAARGKVDDASAKVAAARTDLVSRGAIADTAPAATTIAAFLGSWSDTYQRILQLAPAVWLELASPMLLAYGFAPIQGRAQGPSQAVTHLAQPHPEPLPASGEKAPETLKPSLKRKPRRKQSSRPKAGTNGYWLDRLERRRPDLAKRIFNGEMSVNRATIMAGWRKSPVRLVASQ